MQNAKWGEPLKENQVLEMSFEFAVRIVNLYKYLTGERKEYVMSKQLLRCGTSIGANVTEAQRGQSKADFYAKMCIALKEANETQYWLRLLHRTEYLNTSHFDSINTDIQQLLGLLTAICKTTESSK
jgi:four helix bundle protein